MGPKDAQMLQNSTCLRIAETAGSGIPENIGCFEPMTSSVDSEFVECLGCFVRSWVQWLPVSRRPHR